MREETKTRTQRLLKPASSRSAWGYISFIILRREAGITMSNIPPGSIRRGASAATRRSSASAICIRKNAAQETRIRNLYCLPEQRLSSIWPASLPRAVRRLRSAGVWPGHAPDPDSRWLYFAYPQAAIVPPPASATSELQSGLELRLVLRSTVHTHMHSSHVCRLRPQRHNTSRWPGQNPGERPTPAGAHPQADPSRRRLPGPQP